MQQTRTNVLPYQTLSFIPRGENEVEAIRETIELIESVPNDIKLLRQELNQLKYSYYYFKSIGALRRYLDKDFEQSFFSRGNKRFFGDSKYKWSTKTQMLTITTGHGEACYIPVVYDGKLELRCV